MSAKTRYLVLDVSQVPAAINEIKNARGDILSINAPTTINKPPQTREIWFFCSATEAEICTRAGIGYDGKAPITGNGGDNA